MKRWEFLRLSLATAAGVALSSAVRAEDRPGVVRIGTQKGGFFFPAVRQRHTVENAFKPLGVDVQWVEFQFGPPLLEAINVGSVDFGYVGDAPPIFAQAANARIRYAAAVKQEAARRRSSCDRDRRSRRSPISKASASPSARDRAHTICWSRRSRRPGSLGATSSRSPSHPPMRPRPLLRGRSMPGRSGTPILRWPS